MSKSDLHSFHAEHRGCFTTLNGVEVIESYGAPAEEYRALRESAGVLDLSFRSRLCLTGADRQRFLNGQVTNNVKDLPPGKSCYAALVTAKGKLVSDLNIHCLAEEFLLEFEPGLSAKVSQRLEQYIIADDVQVIDVADHYGLISVQGPRSAEVMTALGLAAETLPQPGRLIQIAGTEFGEICCASQPRGTRVGFDVFAPTAALQAMAARLTASAEKHGGRLCGWQALETIRMESGIPRFGLDMDESNLAPEAGIEARAISYSKGCYIGQEVIARIRTYGQVAKSLRGLVLGPPNASASVPSRGAKLFHEGKDVGYVTSAILSPALNAIIAFGYVRKECNGVGTELQLEPGPTGERRIAKIVALPFVEA